LFNIVMCLSASLLRVLPSFTTIETYALYYKT